MEGGGGAAELPNLGLAIPCLGPGPTQVSRVPGQEIFRGWPGPPVGRPGFQAGRLWGLAGVLGTLAGNWADGYRHVGQNQAICQPEATYNPNLLFHTECPYLLFNLHRFVGPGISL